MSLSRTNTQVEEALGAASSGDRDALERLFRGLIQGPLFIPDRHQAHPLSDAPQYPSDLVSVLGIQCKEVVMVPLFTNPALIKAWSQLALTYREVSGPQAFGLIPDGWWAILNPGEELQKELSAWEIAQLRQGEGAISELLQDALQEEAGSPITVRSADPKTFPSLCTKLTAHCERRGEIESLYFLIEEQLKDDQRSETLLIGAKLTGCSESVGDEIRKELQGLVGHDQVGGYPYRVVVSTSKEAQLIFQIFNQSEPLYRRRRASFFSRIAGRIRRKHQETPR